MPRGDGTGPMGLGPTGWGRGGCIGPRGGGFGLWGGGGGFGLGRGMRRRWPVMSYQPAAPDADLLEEQADLLERRAAACRAMAKKAKDTNPKVD